MRLRETGTVTVAGSDGNFAFEGVDAGTRITIHAEFGFLWGEAGFTLDTDPGPEFVLPEPIRIAFRGATHEHVTVTAASGETSGLSRFGSVSSIEGLELLEGVPSLAELLEGAPGVAIRSLGPGAARPIIRGFDGDRVLITEDGVRTGDIGSGAAEQGTFADPTQAERIEVVRGAGGAALRDERRRRGREPRLPRFPTGAFRGIRIPGPRESRRRERRRRTLRGRPDAGRRRRLVRLGRRQHPEDRRLPVAARQRGRLLDRHGPGRGRFRRPRRPRLPLGGRPPRRQPLRGPARGNAPRGGSGRGRGNGGSRHGAAPATHRFRVPGPGGHLRFGGVHGPLQRFRPGRDRNGGRRAS